MKGNIIYMSKEDVLKSTDEEIVVEGNTEELNKKDVIGGVVLLRTKEDGIIMQPYENLGIVDLTVFAEYLKQLVDIEWKKRIEGGELED